MIVLDTNVISALMSQTRDRAVDRWLDTVEPGDLWLPALAIYEVSGGIEVNSEGCRKRELVAALDRLLTSSFKDRILAFDRDAALAAARIGGIRERRGRPAGEIDTMLAGICTCRRAAIATRNVRHFSDLDVPVINPWTSSG